jgi:adenylate kinase family enzyme
VLVFTLTEEAAVARLVKRGETSGRADDNEETIRSRMAVFAAESQPVIDELKGTGRVAEIDSQGSVEDVFERIYPIMEQLQRLGEFDKCFAVW